MSDTAYGPVQVAVTLSHGRITAGPRHVEHAVGTVFSFDLRAPVTRPVRRDPHTDQPATALLSLTLTGRHLTGTGAYATAAFAMGAGARDWVEALDGHEALGITAAGEVWRTPGLPGATGAKP
ncbi:hypothetical protein [Streptomyces violaceusniger]|uniref:hypothetical protein n=1 Tax=Streptomyces violaceusniger TaxID=68280 RepID=UPI0038093240